MNAKTTTYGQPVKNRKDALQLSKQLKELVTRWNGVGEDEPISIKMWGSLLEGKPTSDRRLIVQCESRDTRVVLTVEFHWEGDADTSYSIETTSTTSTWGQDDWQGAFNEIRAWILHSVLISHLMGRCSLPDDTLSQFMDYIGTHAPLP